MATKGLPAIHSVIAVVPGAASQREQALTIVPDANRFAWTRSCMT